MKVNQFRRGMICRVDGDLWQIVAMDLHAPGNWRSMFQVKLKNVVRGNVVTKRLNPTEELEDVFVETRDMEYLYREGEDFVFMDTENYEQTSLSAEHIGDNAGYLKLNEVVKVQFIDGRPVNVELPATVILEVTETEPGLRGATVTNVLKPAKLETGATVKVPNFVAVGDKVKVDTRTGEFLGRA